MNTGTPTGVDCPTPNPLANLPHPDDVRQRLGERLREVQLLRRLLKLSDQAYRNRTATTTPDNLASGTPTDFQHATDRSAS